MSCLHTSSDDNLCLFYLGFWFSKIAFTHSLTARDGGRSQEAIHRNDESSNSSSGPGIRREGIPSPASLAEVIRTARLLLIEQAGESLLVRSQV